MKMKTEMQPYDLEAVYDAEIAPLMTRIIEICNRHKMPMLATFVYAHDETSHLCTTNLLRDDWTPQDVEAARHMIKEGFIAYTVRRPFSTPASVPAEPESPQSNQ